MTQTLTIIHGATGRMGQALLHEIASATDSQLQIVAALVRPGSSFVGESLACVLGKTAPFLEFTDVLDSAVTAHVMVDFSSGDGFDAALALALEKKIAFVSGTTGLHPQQMQALQQAALHIPVLWSANFSIGVAVLQHLVQMAAQLLPADCDAEIMEMHHAQKRDAPSGTALRLGRAIADARGVSFDAVAQFHRHGNNTPRVSGEIGFASLRAADIVGEHSVIFTSHGERIELTHRASHRGVFAQGAAQAAQWLAMQSAGCYELKDMFNKVTGCS